jgi:hypothetical protein
LAEGFDELFIEGVSFEVSGGFFASLFFEEVLPISS